MAATQAHALCRETNLSFEISATEQLVLSKLGLPEPAELPTKRMQHRLTFRNERTLYRRPSSLSGKPIISIYAPEKPHTVYAVDEWWSDVWDGLDHGKEFDFSRGFFEQFAELQLRVPRISLFNVNPHNSDYCQQAYNNKNCYLCMVVKDCEDSQYVSHSNRVRDSFDCDYIQNAELCYECLDSDKLYACVGCQHCQNSHELYFSIDCIGCSHCIGCKGLRNQKYCILNQQFPKEEYFAYLSELQLSSRTGYQRASKELLAKAARLTPRNDFNINAQESSGANLINVSSCSNCFDSFELERCANCTWAFESNHCSDIYGMGTSQWVYGSVGVENLSSAAFCTFVSDSSDSYYSDLSFYCREIFGCVGLRRKSYCILNKQYTAEAYHRLKAEIIAHMQKTGEWGKFFPAELSPFAYNESVAAERFPLPELEAKELGYCWRPVETKEYQSSSTEVPDRISEIADDFSKQLLSCSATGKNFKLTVPELAYFRKQGLAAPDTCPDHRYAMRMKRRS